MGRAEYARRLADQGRLAEFCLIVVERALRPAAAAAIAHRCQRAVQGADVVGGVHTGPGAFYKVIPHNVIVYIASVPFFLAMIAFIVGIIMFWRDIGAKASDLFSIPNLIQASKDVGKMTYMAGGGHGCNYPDDNFSHGRRHAHQMTMWGFLLCFAATSVATIYHYVFGWEAPYGYFSIPVILGTIGGIGIVFGPIRLLMIK